MSQGVILYGETTRDLYDAWHRKVGAAPTIPQDKIQPLFNDLHLYPSKSQVFEMLHCARECSQRNTDTAIQRNTDTTIQRNTDTATIQRNTDPSITFGEFCVFATELRKHYTNHDRDPGAVEALPVQVSKVPEKRRKAELRTQRSTTSAYDVFLGGSCNPTTWRKDVAIPHLKGRGITFYNPQQANWVPEMIELEHQVNIGTNNKIIKNIKSRNISLRV